jgi:DNA-binding NtrC family response regulator
MQMFNQMIRTARMASEAKAPVLGGNSMAAHALRQMVMLAAQTTDPVQLSGPDGGGHIELARAIHKHSGLAASPFVDASCDRQAGSQLPVAWRGSLFVGDVSNLAHSQQASLLDWMMGAAGQSARVISVRPEHIAATVGIIPELQKQLSRTSIAYPALARRKDDIPIILQRLWATSAFPLPPIFDRTAWRAVMEHGWPGDFAELQNFADKMSRKFGGVGVSYDDVQRILQSGRGRDRPTAQFNLKDHLAQEEKLFLIEALLRSQGVVQQAAELSGLKRTTFLAKMRRHGLTRP